MREAAARSREDGRKHPRIGRGSFGENCGEQASTFRVGVGQHKSRQL